MSRKTLAIIFTVRQKGLAENPVSVGHGLPAPDHTGFPDNFIDHVGIMAVMIDRRGIIRRFNRKAEDMTGYSRDEALGQDLFSLMLAEPDAILPGYS